jgi:hypothetical protein
MDTALVPQKIIVHVSQTINAVVIIAISKVEKLLDLAPHVQPPVALEVFIRVLHQQVVLLVMLFLQELQHRVPMIIATPVK